MSIQISSSIQTGLPNTPQTKDIELYTQLSKVYAAIHRMILEETNNTRQVAVASAALAAGQIVTLTNNAGVLTAGLANATGNTKLAYGFVNVAVASGVAVEVQSIGLNQNCTGLTTAGICYLNTVDGSITQVKPAAAGNVVQVLGHALSATTMFFNSTLNFTQL